MFQCGLIYPKTVLHISHIFFCLFRDVDVSVLFLIIASLLWPVLRTVSERCVFMKAFAWSIISSSTWSTALLLLHRLSVDDCLIKRTAVCAHIVPAIGKMIVVEGSHEGQWFCGVCNGISYGFCRAANGSLSAARQRAGRAEVT